MGSKYPATIKNLPVMWEIQVLSLSQEDSLEKGMAGHSSILAWRIPSAVKPDSPWGRRVGHDWSDLAAAAVAGEVQVKIASVTALFEYDGK